MLKGYTCDQLKNLSAQSSVAEDDVITSIRISVHNYMCFYQTHVTSRGQLFIESCNPDNPVCPVLFVENFLSPDILRLINIDKVESFRPTKFPEIEFTRRLDFVHNPPTHKDLHSILS